MAIKLNINERDVDVDVAPETPLLWVLRDHVGLTGTKYGCGGGYCGACTVHVDGNAVRSCQLPVSGLSASAIHTVEHIDLLNPELTATWIANNVAQCGYCQAGQLMSAAALLEANPAPTDAEIDAAMAGNICRCGAYVRIRSSIHEAAKRRSEEGSA